MLDHGRPGARGVRPGAHGLNNQRPPGGSRNPYEPLRFCGLGGLTRVVRVCARTRDVTARRPMPSGSPSGTPPPRAGPMRVGPLLSWDPRLHTGSLPEIKFQKKGDMGMISLERIGSVPAMWGFVGWPVIEHFG